MPSKMVDAPLTAEIKDFNVVIEHGINSKTDSEEACSSDPAYDTSTALTLTCEILRPSEHSGYTLELELFSSHIDAYRRKYTSTLEDWKNPKSESTEDFYILPPSIGHIGRSRNKKMTGYLYVSPKVTSDFLKAFEYKKPMFLEVSAKKRNGDRTVSHLTIQHAPLN
jgi:hypothetical protein